MGSTMIKLGNVIRNLQSVKEVQGRDGNWNFSPYMLGLYNGLELAISMLSNREPVYKDKPEVWLQDIKTEYKEKASEPIIQTKTSNGRSRKVHRRNTDGTL